MDRRRLQFNFEDILMSMPTPGGDAGRTERGILTDRFVLRFSAANHPLGRLIEGYAPPREQSRLELISQHRSLVWSTAERLGRKPYMVRSLLATTCQLPAIERNPAILEATRWFLSACDGPAWISCLPCMPSTTPGLRSIYPDFIRSDLRTVPGSVRCQRRNAPLQFGCGLPPLRLDERWFAYEPAQRRLRTRMYQSTRERIIHYTNRPRDPELMRGFSLAEPGEDDDIFKIVGGAVTGSRCFFDKSTDVWAYPTISINTLNPISLHVRTLSFCLHPGDGRLCSITIARKSFDLTIGQQPLQRELLISDGICEQRAQEDP